jgi:hypothetical protein
MQNATIIWTISGVIAAACFARGLSLGELIWYTIGMFFLAGAAILWISLESNMVVQHKIVLGVIGAITGALVLLSAGEYIRPTAANAQAPSNKNASTVIENSGGGIGADISVQGSQGSASPTVGLETGGLTVTQTGSGTGIKVTVGGNGPAIGVRSTVTNTTPAQ